MFINYIYEISHLQIEDLGEVWMKKGQSTCATGDVKHVSLPELCHVAESAAGT